GSNRQRLHHHVVRALPGGANGVAMEKKSGTYKASVDVSAVRKGLNKYLANFAKENKMQPFDAKGLMGMKKLKVVAFVQNDTTKDVYQAAQIDVPEAKEEDKTDDKKEDEKKDEKKDKDEKKEKKEDKKEKD